MRDQEQTREELIAELVALRGRVAELEAQLRHPAGARVEPLSGAARNEAERDPDRLQAILTTAIECLPFDFFALGPDGRCILQNAAARQHFGSGIGKTAEEMPVDEQLRSAWLDNQRRAFAGERVEGDVVVTVHGEKRHCYHVVTPVRSGEAICGILGVNMDITDRVRAEEAVRESEQRYRTLAEASPDIIYILDQAGRLLYANRTAAASVGLSPASLVGKTPHDFFPPDTARQYMQRIRTLFETGEARETEDRYRLGAQDVWLNVRSIPIRDEHGRATALMGVCRDITDRKRSEAALQESEQRFRSLFQHSAVGTVITRDGSTLLHVNPAFCALLGYSEQELLGKTIRSITHPDDWEISSAAIRQTLEGGPRTQEFEKRYVTKSGQLLWGEVNFTLVSDAEGKPDYFLTQVFDITGRKRAEEELAKNRAMLQAAIECLPFDFFAIGADGYYLMENAACRARWGRLTGHRLEDMAPNDELRALWLDNNRRAFAGEKVEGEATITVAGEQRIVHNILTPIRDAAHSYGILGVNIDITERKRAEEALREAHDELERRVEQRTLALRQSHEQLRTIYDGMIEGLVITEVETKRFVRVNSSMCRMLGYSAEELLSASLPDIHPPEEVTNDLARFQTVAEGRRSINENRPVRRKDGSLFYADITGHPIVYEGRPCVLALFRDVSERRRAEAALQQSHDELRAIYDEVLDGIVLVDVENPLPIRANAAICRMLGYGEAELKTMLPAQVHPPEAMPEILEHLHAVAEGRVARFENMPFLRRDGSVFYADVVSSRILYNERLCRISFLHDVTARKRAEEALRESEKRFRSYFEQGLIGMAVSSAENRWIQVNDRLCHMLGYSRDELLGMKWTDLTHPDDLPGNLAPQQRLLAGEIEHYTIDKRFLRKDGGVVHATVFARCFRHPDGSVDHVLALVEDITERKLAQEAVAESEAKYRQLIETTDTGYLILDQRGRVVDANAEYIRMSGHHALGEIRGRSVLEWTASSDVDRNRSEVAKCLQTGFVRQLEVEYRHPDGKVIPVEINATCIETKDGTRILSLCRDITERKHAQEALERERQSLWRMLQASDHERQIISYEIHDGLAQYLAAATMQFQSHAALREHSPGEAEKAYQTAVQLVRQAHSESRRLISEVRPPIIDEIGLETAISHLVHEQRRRGGPRIKFNSEVQFGRLPPILENAIYRIVQEALTNACKHSRSKNVAVTMTQEGQDVRLEVRDWGIGFDPRAVEKGHFGLEGIRQRVRLLGGRLSIESSAESGTLLQVLVPIVEKQLDG